MVLGWVPSSDSVTSCNVPMPSYQSLLIRMVGHCFVQWSPKFPGWLPRVLNVHKFQMNGLCGYIVDLLLLWHWRAIVPVLVHWMIWEQTSSVLTTIVLNNLVKLTKFWEGHLDFHEVCNYFIRLKFTLLIAKQACSLFWLIRSRSWTACGFGEASSF